MLFVTRFPDAVSQLAGYMVAGFALVWIANIYINLFTLLRVPIKNDKKE
ncbi:MAG: hypothetical protein SGI88_09035 [Candidatus Hydrogenedentes bacterium]|nr:hypothetical protein [Candidatus Hydrogenedentota bacterium]